MTVTAGLLTLLSNLLLMNCFSIPGHAAGDNSYALENLGITSAGDIYVSTTVHSIVYSVLPGSSYTLTFPTSSYSGTYNIFRAGLTSSYPAVNVPVDIVAMSSSDLDFVSGEMTFTFDTVTGDNYFVAFIAYQMSDSDFEAALNSVTPRLYRNLSSDVNFSPNELYPGGEVTFFLSAGGDSGSYTYDVNITSSAEVTTSLFSGVASGQYSYPIPYNFSPGVYSVEIVTHGTYSDVSDTFTLTIEEVPDWDDIDDGGGGGRYHAPDWDDIGEYRPPDSLSYLFHSAFQTVIGPIIGPIGIVVILVLLVATWWFHR